MKIYISLNPKKVIRKNYPNFINKNLAIIDIPNFAKQYGYVNYKKDIFQNYILTQEIKKKFKTYYNSRRFKSILYIVDEVDENFIYDIKMFLEEQKIYFLDYVLVDCYDNVDHKMYNYFDDVI